MGVTKGLAGIKFSGSPNNQGFCKQIYKNIIIKIITPNRSFLEKYGWNGILSKFLFNPNGFLDPVVWRNNRWIIENPLITKGNKKCKEKNRVNVALSTANPPHNQ